MGKWLSDNLSKDLLTASILLGLKDLIVVNIIRLQGFSHFPIFPTAVV